MNAATLSRRYGREPVSAYIGEGWRLMPFEIGGVAFHRVGRSAITIGAPLGPEEDAAEATSAFRQHCRSKGWRPVIFQAASPVDGLRSYLIAREAFLDVDGFSLSGSAMANARHSVSRARRDGINVSWRRWSECDAGTRAEIALISASWSRGRPELTFTYGRLNDIPNDAWVGLVVAPGGRIEALSTWRPLPAGPGLVLDLLRRREDSTPGAVELMIVEAVELARSQSLAWLSLGSVCQSDDLPRWLRIVLATAASCGGSGLSSFKEKFCPRWEDRYLALPARTAGVAGVVALAIAHVRGARVRPEATEDARLRRPAVRWAAAAGVTASLCAFGVGAAAHDVGWPVARPLQLSLSSAAATIAPVLSTGAPWASAHVSPAPLAARLPRNVRPASAPSHVVSTSRSASSAQALKPEPDRSVASHGPTALCAPTGATQPAVRESAHGAPRTKTSSGSRTSNPGLRCGAVVKAPPAALPAAAPATRPAARPASPPPTSEKPRMAPRGKPVGHHSAVSQSAHNIKLGGSNP